MTGTGQAENVVSLSQPGRILDVLEEAVAARRSPERSGWSAATHLGRDLERHFGVRTSPQALEHALRILQRRRRVNLRVDDDGRVWYRGAS